MHKVAVLGEMLAISAVIMVTMFVFAHMGRPDRLWHMLPIIGIYNFPHSMLGWDVLVLNGYLFLNLVCGFYYLGASIPDSRSTGNGSCRWCGSRSSGRCPSTPSRPS
ncbi:MAG: polysulfide reductase NrfD [Rhodocyclaceae bacterium]|nr:polysulfide reductase NrfD [Rhodocyclaceae bacterium]